MAKDTYDNEWLCIDCTMYVVNRDESGNSPDWDKESLLLEMEQFLFTPTGEQEDFGTVQCGGCGTHLAGYRHEFAIEKNNN